MPKKAMEQLTESMFYVLMALTDAPRCGIDIAEAIEKRTAGRVRLGPATLYTLLISASKLTPSETSFMIAKRTF